MRSILAFAGAPLLLVVLVGCGSDDAAGTASTTPTTVAALSEACDTAVAETVERLNTVLDAIEGDEVERGSALPDVGAPLADGCAEADAALMWSDLITEMWTDAPDGSELRVSASVTLVLEMCDLAAGLPLRTSAELSCGLAATLPVEPWYET